MSRLVPLLSTVLRLSQCHLPIASSSSISSRSFGDVDGERSSSSVGAQAWSSSPGRRGSGRASRSPSPSPSDASPGRVLQMTQRKDSKDIAQRFCQHVCLALAALATFDAGESEWVKKLDRRRRFLTMLVYLYMYVCMLC